MEAERPAHRYEMVNVRPAYIIFEHEVNSGATRSYFSTEDVPPIEEYREGRGVWKHLGVAQSFRFDLRDTTTGDLTPLDDLLGLVPYTSCPEDTDVHKIGWFAEEQKIWIYVAVSHRRMDAAAMSEWIGKLKVLNRYFGERLSTPNKRILILPDYFGLHERFTHGLLMVDFGLTTMEAEPAATAAAGV